MMEHILFFLAAAVCIFIGCFIVGISIMRSVDYLCDRISSEVVKKLKGVGK